jgi:hypothetical protein
MLTSNTNPNPNPSVLHNPTSHYSDWVDKHFGSRAIFYNKDSLDNIMEVSFMMMMIITMIMTRMVVI